MLAWIAEQLAGTVIVCKCPEISIPLARNLGFRGFDPHADTETLKARKEFTVGIQRGFQWMILNSRDLADS
jgi:hypothetical protein